MLTLFAGFSGVCIFLLGYQAGATAERRVWTARYPQVKGGS